MHVIRRNQQDSLEKLIDYFSAVALIGVRQVGKTTLAKVLPPTGDWPCTTNLGTSTAGLVTRRLSRTFNPFLKFLDRYEGCSLSFEPYGSTFR